MIVWFGFRRISSLMGGVCSWRRDNADEYTIHRGVSCRNFKSGISQWLGTSYFQPIVDYHQGKDNVPSLLELCIYRIRQVLGFVWLAGGSNGVLLVCKSYAFQLQQDIDKYTSFYMLPRDVSQLIFNDLVCCHSLSDASIEAFRDCALQVTYNWMCPLTNLNIWIHIHLIVMYNSAGHMSGRLSRSKRPLDECRLFARIIFTFASSL